MKDWRKLFEERSPTMNYFPEDVLDQIRPSDPDSPDYGSPTAADRELIQKELQSVVQSGISVELQVPEDEERAMGGDGWDTIWLVLGGGAAALGAYSGLKDVAGDFRRLMQKLRSDDSGADIGETGAILSAWDYVAPAESGIDVTFEYVAPLRRANSEGWTVHAGWLVGFTVNDQAVSVIVGSDGTVTGAVPGPAASDVDRIAKKE